MRSGTEGRGKQATSVHSFQPLILASFHSILLLLSSSSLGGLCHPPRAKAVGNVLDCCCFFPRYFGIRVAGLEIIISARVLHGLHTILLDREWIEYVNLLSDLGSRGYYVPVPLAIESTTEEPFDSDRSEDDGQSSGDEHLVKRSHWTMILHLVMSSYWTSLHPVM
jgi:hypothetical protein